MRIALIAPPFISVPPKQYGGTELFIANLAAELSRTGIDVVVYTNGESTVPVERRWIYPKQQWPITGEIHDSLRDINHSSWAVRDAIDSGCDIVHLNNTAGLANCRLTSLPFVYTMHHPAIADLTEFYLEFPQIDYVNISDFQRGQLPLPKKRTIYHGLDLDTYRCGTGSREYAVFLGRIAPMKGAHVAIQVAKEAGIPLKIAGEVQPIFQEYFDQQVKPHIDGKFIEFVGEVNVEEKNELLGSARALLFPISWDEPFGLVMIEAMACGAPVLAFTAGSVPEIVIDGESGYNCSDASAMAKRLREEPIPAQRVRTYFEQNFSRVTMAAKYVELYREILARGSAQSTFGLGTARDDNGLSAAEEKAVA